MQEKHLFEYAVIRVVPRVEREEFMNVGVILYCAGKGFLQTRCTLNEARVQAFSPELDMDELQERLQAFDRICKGRSEGGTIGQLPIASRFRWLTATRSTIVQTSPVHPGLCEDPEEKINQLFQQLVL
ncbi:DUF3037 domain-containing protein [Pontibacter arcticus]|uniref:DUF3037 domain-containing protein n=1 Tax=Pontibacter arcticus TaxID=2080288 RepID=A0A364RFM0_9BACT|nr:DUF3037 domain-containing protein [Pontibacter arcticus]RAU83148.1 DUF3037 domain-containing protein [Pontibacter arcticus]